MKLGETRKEISILDVPELKNKYYTPGEDVYIGDINLRGTRITTLKHLPKVIRGDFICASTWITSLIDGPEEVHGNFECNNTLLKSLEGGPSIVTGNYDCYTTSVNSLKGVPNIVYNLTLGYTEISSFEYAPKIIKGDFFCNQTRIVSASGINKHIQRIGGKIILDGRVTHLLGLLYIEGLKRVIVDNISSKATRIMNKHLAKGRDIFKCQEELIDAGLIEQAKL